MVGFLGAYTTFSTLMLESWRLVEDAAIGLALVNIVGSCVLGLVGSSSASRSVAASRESATATRRSYLLTDLLLHVRP